MLSQSGGPWSGFYPRRGCQLLSFRAVSGIDTTPDCLEAAPRDYLISGSVCHFLQAIATIDQLSVGRGSDAAQLTAVQRLVGIVGNN